MTPQMERLLDKARRSLARARQLASEGDCDMAVSRAYYAMFYVAKAALMPKGATSSKHRGTIQAFWEQFVKPGRIAATYHDMFNDAFQHRLIGDYSSDIVVTREEAERVVAHAEEFLRAITPLIT